MELEKIRKKLDSIDKQIVELYEKRIETIKEVAYYKLEKNKEVLDTARETEKIQQVKGFLEDTNNSQGIEALYRVIMAESRHIQSTMIEQRKNIQGTIRGEK